MDMHEIIRSTTTLLTVYGLKLIGAVVILIVGWLASSWAGRAMMRLSRRASKLDPTLTTFLASFVRWAILAFTIIAVLSQFGVETTSLIAVLGAASIAVGLALQGTLSHFASGVMLGCLKNRQRAWSTTQLMMRRLLDHAKSHACTPPSIQRSAQSMRFNCATRRVRPVPGFIQL